MNSVGAAQELIEGDAEFVAPAARRNEVLGWVRAGVRDFSISRAAVAWGIPIPRDPGQTVYVWFDALFGYASGAVGFENRKGVGQERMKGKELR